MARRWKQLKRHPISARYRDLKGQQWEDFLAGMTKRSIKHRPIMLKDNLVLDGWQRQRACVEKGIEPPYRNFPKGEDEEEYVAMMNDDRRHDTPEEVCQHRNERIARVAKAREEGISTRAIAEKENISQSQVLKDLKTVGEHQCSSDPLVDGIEPSPGPIAPASGKVKGIDGKEYPATEQKLLCAACQTKQRKGLALPANCGDCPKPRKAGKKKSSKAKTSKNGALVPKIQDFIKLGGGMVRLLDDFSKHFGLIRAVKRPGEKAPVIETPEVRAIKKDIQSIVTEVEKWHEKMLRLCSKPKDD